MGRTVFDFLSAKTETHEDVLRAACCAHPDLYRCYAPCRPFGRSVTCLNCEEMYADDTRFMTWLWTWFIAPFWNGRVVVTGPLRKEGE